MNRLLLASLVLLFILFPASAAESVYHYLEGLDDHHNVVVGLNGTSGDSLAASTIVVWLATEKQIDLDIVLENQINPKESSILVGHPCGNSLIELSCEDWPYPPGVGILRVMGENLVVSGTTTADIALAAKTLTQYKQDAFDALSDSDFILIRTENGNIVAEAAKRDHEFVCGDGVCETGERCFSDCAETTCDDVCREKGFVGAACRILPTNPSVSLCNANEEQQGLGYCATGYVCCCEQEAPSVQEQEKLPDTPADEPEEELSIFQRFLRWLKNLFS